MFEARKAAGDYSSKTLKTPKFNCDTRFENYIYQLYSEFRERYALLLEVLESTKEEFRQGLSTERKKADTAGEVRRQQREHLQLAQPAHRHQGFDGEGHVQGRPHGAARGGHQQDQGGTLAADPEPPARQGG